MSVGFVEIVSGEEYTLGANGKLKTPRGEVLLDERKFLSGVLSGEKVVVLWEDALVHYDLEGNALTEVPFYSSTPMTLIANQNFVVLVGEKIYTFFLPSLQQVGTPLHLSFPCVGGHITKDHLFLLLPSAFQVYSLPQVKLPILSGETKLLHSLTFVSVPSFLTLGIPSERMVFPLGSANHVHFVSFNGRSLLHHFSLPLPEEVYQMVMEENKITKENNLIAQGKNHLYLWSISRSKLSPVTSIELQGTTQLVPRSLYVGEKKILVSTSEGIERFEKVSSD